MTEIHAKPVVAIIGAGPAGLFGAYSLVEQGARIVLLNRDIKPGGLAEHGIYYDKYSIKEGLRKQFRKILDNNILSNHWLVSMVAPEMLERGEGSITIISSIGGLKGSPIIGAYGISKAADMQMARNFATEFGSRGVRVNCVAPGLIRTDMARALWEEPETLKKSTAAAALKRIGEPPEIAGAVVFLASRAGAFTTGQTIVCDGGATITGGA